MALPPRERPSAPPTRGGGGTAPHKLVHKCTFAPVRACAAALAVLRNAHYSALLSPLRVSPGSPADVRLLPRTVAGGLRCAWLCTFYVRTRRLVPSRPCPWRRPMKTVSERPPPCTKPQMSRPSTRATGSRATLTARAWARRVGFLGHRRNRRCPLNTLTPKTICEGLCGPVHVNALFGHANALFGGCRVPVEFPLSCRVVEARAQCMVYLLLQICLLARRGRAGPPALRGPTS